jgi:hypothetical protein
LSGERKKEQQTCFENKMSVDEGYAQPEGAHLPLVAGAPERGPQDEHHDLDERDRGDSFADDHRGVFVEDKGSQVPIDCDDNPSAQDCSVEAGESIVRSLARARVVRKR